MEGGERVAVGIPGFVMVATLTIPKEDTTDQLTDRLDVWNFCFRNCVLNCRAEAKHCHSAPAGAQRWALELKLCVRGANGLGRRILCVSLYN